MIDQATHLRKKILKKGNKENNHSRIIAIASGKGGVGKTNILVNLGLVLHRAGQRVLLLDADLGTANIDVLLGLSARYNLSHVLKGKCFFEDALLKGPEGIDILPGTSGVEDLINISYVEIKRLLTASSQIEEKYDIILIDIGAGIHHTVTNFISACDEVIVVLTPEPTAIMDAYSLIKILVNHKYINNISIIVNQVYSHKEGEQVAQRMKKTIKDYLKIEIKILGYIPYDAYVRHSVKEQSALVVTYPQSGVVTALNKISAKMLNQVKEPVARGITGFIYRVVGLFNRN